MKGRFILTVEDTETIGAIRAKAEAYAADQGATLLWPPQFIPRLKWSESMREIWPEGWGPQPEKINECLFFEMERP